MAFLKEEYKWLSVFVVLLGGILCALFSVEDQHTKLDGVLTTFAFFLGAILSASAGWLGMMVATDGAISASRDSEAPSRHRGDSFPGMMAVGGFISDFEPFRTASRPRIAQATRARRRPAPARR